MPLAAEPVTLSAEQIDLLNRLLSATRHDVANCLMAVVSLGELVRMGYKDSRAGTGPALEKHLKMSQLVGAFKHDFEWTFGLERAGGPFPQPCLRESPFFARSKPLALLDPSGGRTCPQCSRPFDYEALGLPCRTSPPASMSNSANTRFCNCVVLREAPVTLTAGEVDHLHRQLLAMCVKVDNRLARIAEATAAIRDHSEMDHEVSCTAIAEGFPVIQEEIRRFSDEFEKVLGILHPSR
jgi:hypothetical protein